MAAAAQFPDEFPDEELLRLGRGVCLIKTKDSKGKGWRGTGFHYGGGWIMSNAHVFQDVKDDETMHSMISSATFTFLKCGMVEDENYVKIIRSTEDNRVVFGARNRTAFIHHLHVTPDGKADITNMDIAMIKLGKQCEVGQPEKDIISGKKEDELMFKLQEPKVGEVKQKKECQLSAIVQSPPHVSKVNKEVYEKVKDEVIEVYGVHFAGSDNVKFVRSNIIEITEATNNAVPMMIINNSKNAFPPGSSGCPVMILKDGKYWLAGLNFAADKKTPGQDINTKEYALRWEGGIDHHVGNEVGVSIISMIGPYLANKRLGLKAQAEEGRNALVQIAGDHQLTIYLPDGEPI